jgi:hypothetical protein
MNDDATLREHFARLRRAEEPSTPGFERIVGLPRHSDRGLQTPAMAACLALAVLAVVILRLSHPHRVPSTGAAAPMLADWHSPTDFLLDTPGRELLYAIPDIGRLPPVPTTAPARRAGKEHS